VGAAKEREAHMQATITYRCNRATLVICTGSPDRRKVRRRGQTVPRDLLIGFRFALRLTWIAL
jgi:hypothetical protein